MLLKYIVDDCSNGKTVKFILKTKLDLSERLVKRLKYAGKILLNGGQCHVNASVKAGDTVEANIDFNEESDDILPEDIPLDIIYEDNALIIINKAPGIVVHPTALHYSGTVANALKRHYNENGEFCKIRPVSRLDKDTSGLVVFAKNQFIQESLIRQMPSAVRGHSSAETRKRDTPLPAVGILTEECPNGDPFCGMSPFEEVFVKKYKGIVRGIVSPPEGIIDLPIERLPGSIMLRHTSPSGAPSLTRYKVLEHLADASLLEFLLETGRTHQIRVHCKAIGHPILGDGLYGNSQTDINIIKRHALHSYMISFRHPVSGKLLEFESGFPEDIEHALEILRK